VMRTPVFAANWKMNVGPRDATEFMRTFLAQYAPHADRTVIIFPPALSLCAVAESTHERDDILLGVQNIFREPKGAFTGESSAPMARQAGARFALVGHSERRHVFGETNLEVAQKMVIAPQFGLTPVLCVGETLAQRQMDAAEAIVMEQLEVGISSLHKGTTPQIIVAYEPVWAIGTGHSATPDDASSMHRVIRKKLRALAPDSDDIPILYGGSVNTKNAEALLSADGVDGLLVGSACLDPAGWAEICRT